MSENVKSASEKTIAKTSKKVTPKKAKVFEISLRLTVPPDAKRPSMDAIKQSVQQFCNFEPTYNGIVVGKTGLREVTKVNTKAQDK